jgi:hypothetical protein
LVVPAALAAFQSSPHCFITLAALAAFTPAKLSSPATRRADKPAPMETFIMTSPFNFTLWPPRLGAERRSPSPIAAMRRDRAFNGLTPLNSE